jgi:carbamoyltransferase
MRILGLFDDHNCGATIVQDGKIVGAIEEERLSRIKLHNGNTKDGPPRRSLAQVLEMTKSNSTNIDRIAVAIQPPSELQKYIFQDLYKGQKNWKWIAASLFGNFSWDPYHPFYPYLYNRGRIRRLKKLLKEFNLTNIPIDYIDHHTAHAASAYYTGGELNSHVVTLDGQGDGHSGSYFQGKNGTLEKAITISSYHSIGLFYNFITWLLGYKPNRHEGKITGLAAHGDVKKTETLYNELFSITDTNFRYTLSEKIFQHPFPHRSNYPYFKKEIESRIEGLSREDIAAGIQHIAEQVVTKFVDSAVVNKETSPLKVAGGVFANVRINQKVAELDKIKSVYIFPAMGDGGLSSGAALHSYYTHTEFGVDFTDLPKQQDVYLGPEYSDDDILEEIKKENLRYEHHENIEKKIAELLAEGKVVARFNGRMEYGPRALGNRSILYQATDPTVNDWLNERLNRTEFMPFAPATLYEDRNKCYKNVGENDFPAMFMTITFDCTKELRDTCPAVVHVDKTARPQLVTEESNKSYYNIIKEYRKITGLMSIINTSFNMHEEPIVCTPFDAIRAFNLGHLDYLAMSNFLVYPKEQ